jgi:hypothetical protein
MSSAPSAEDSSQILEQLQQVLPSLYSNGSFSQEQKVFVESQLNAFKERADAWEHCLHFVENTRDPYVLFFSASVFETTLQNSWEDMPESSRMNLRGVLFRFLMSRHDTIPLYVLNKTVKVIVDVGKLDWPERYPDFFGHVLQMASDQKTWNFGLLLLKVMAEEFTSVGRTSVSVTGQRQKQLKMQLLAQLPLLMSTFANLLEQMRDLRQQQTKPGSLQELSRYSEIVVETYQLLAGIPSISPEDRKTLLDERLTDNIISMVTECPQWPCSAHAIAAITALLSNSYFPAELETLIFKVTTNMLGCISNLIKQPQLVTTVHGRNDIFFPQMTEFFKAITQYHFRRFENSAHFPMDQFLLLLFEYTFQLPDPEMFLEALELWKSIFEHVRDVYELCDQTAVSASSLSRVDLYMGGLEAFGKRLVETILYSQNGSVLSEFDDESLGALEDWAYQEAPDGGIADAKSEGGAQTEALLPFARSEVEVYIAKCASMVEKVMGLDPVARPMITLLLPSLSDAVDKYRALLFPNGQLTNSFSHELKFAVNDLTSLVYCFSCGVNTLTKYFADIFESSYQVYTVLLQLAMEILKNRLYTGGHYITKCVVSVIDCLSSFGSWLYLLQEQRHSLPQKFADLVPQVFEHSAVVVVEGLHADVSPPPEEILSSALSFLRTLVFAVRVDAEVVSSSAVQSAFDNIWELTAKLPGRVKEQAAVMVSDKTLLDFEQSGALNATPEYAAKALEVYRSKTMPVFGRLEHICQTALRENARKPFCADTGALSNFRECLRQTKAICNSLNARAKKEKLLCSQIFLPLIGLLVQVLHLCLMPISRSGGTMQRSVSGIAAAKEILGVFETAMSVLRVELGVETASNMISAFVDLFVSNTREDRSGVGGQGRSSSVADELIGALMTGSTTGTMLILTLINFLRVVVEEPKKSFHALHESIYNLMFGTLVPVIFSGPSVVFVDLELSVHRFCRSCLTNHLRTFVVKDGASFRWVSEGKKNVFTTIFQILAQSFVRVNQPPESFQFNLDTLESFNTTHRLYSHPVFRSFRAREFCLNIVNVLCSGTHDLLSSHITKTLYGIALADYEYFRVQILPPLLNEMAGLGVKDAEITSLLESFCADGNQPDLFTFNSNMANFISIRRRCLPGRSS